MIRLQRMEDPSEGQFASALKRPTVQTLAWVSPWSSLSPLRRNIRKYLMLTCTPLLVLSALQRRVGLRCHGEVGAVTTVTGRIALVMADCLTPRKAKTISEVSFTAWA
eukprot:Rmarinus@m.24973